MSFKNTLTTKKNQLSLFRLIQELLGSFAQDIYQDYPHPSLTHSQSDAKVCFFPHKLAYRCNLISLFRVYHLPLNIKENNTLETQN